MGLDYEIVQELLTPTNGIINTNNVDLDCFRDFKYLLNCIFDIYTELDISYDYYIKNCGNYKNDPLNTFRRLKFISYIKIKRRMKQSIYLNIALDHAEKNYSLAKSRELEDYY